MKIKKELAKIGIKPLNKITTAEKNKLIINTITGLLNTFPIFNSKYYELCMKLYCCDMYRAKIDPKLNRVNYFYQNRTIYFDETLQLEKDVVANIIHECIHYIQDIRKPDGQLYKIGLCEFNEYNVVGLGLNEFVLQYITQKIIDQENESRDDEDYINSYVNTLLEELMFILGEDIIIKSAINANEDFKEKLMDTFQEENIYYQLTSAFDEFLEAKQQLDNYSRNQTKENINSMHDRIYNLFQKTQYNMFQKYFATYIKYIDSVEEIDKCKDKMLEYRKLIQCSQNEGIQYAKCLQKEYELLDRKFIEICRKNSKNALIVFNGNAIINLLNNIRKAFFKKESY